MCTICLTKLRIVEDIAELVLALTLSKLEWHNVENNQLIVTNKNLVWKGMDDDIEGELHDNNNIYQYISNFMRLTDVAKFCGNWLFKNMMKYQWSL